MRLRFTKLLFDKLRYIDEDLAGCFIFVILGFSVLIYTMLRDVGLASFLSFNQDITLSLFGFALIRYLFSYLKSQFYMCSIWLCLLVSLSLVLILGNIEFKHDNYILLFFSMSTLTKGLVKFFLYSSFIIIEFGIDNMNDIDLLVDKYKYENTFTFVFKLILVYAVITFIYCCTAKIVELIYGIHYIELFECLIMLVLCLIYKKYFTLISRLLIFDYIFTLIYTKVTYSDLLFVELILLFIVLTMILYFLLKI